MRELLKGVKSLPDVEIGQSPEDFKVIAERTLENREKCIYYLGNVELHSGLVQRSEEAGASRYYPDPLAFYTMLSRAYNEAREGLGAVREMVVARVGRRRWSKRVVVGAVVSVVLVVAWGLSTLLGGPAYERLAVLPPTNLMNDPEQEYFVQGMHIALMVRNPHWFAEVSSLNSFEARLGEHH